MTEERIITAAVVTSGEKGDGPELPMLLKISQDNGIQVDTVIGDTAYSGKENLKLKDKNDQDIKIVAKLNPVTTQGFRKEEDRFDYNKDADMFVCQQDIWPCEKHDMRKRTVAGIRHMLIILT
jgi:hypothetical protein